jgi:hypothetical protein
MSERKSVMSNDSIDAVYAYVERAYVRLQAGDLLIRCLEESSTEPIRQMVEGLVLAGPVSIIALREILAESGRRKAQLLDDMQQVVKGINSSLRSYGVSLEDENTGVQLPDLTPTHFLAILRQQDIRDNATQVACLRIFQESRDLIESLVTRVRLLEDVEKYLWDWFWGIAHQSAHHEPKIV